MGYEQLRDRVIEDVGYARELIIQGDIIGGLTILTGLTDSLENEKELSEKLEQDEHLTL